ncbi:tail fiber domain-containing protein [Paenibacillus mesophilus]|uniref:tail fiber domain-containing protein n=1 Tax=Paenibacillus mesophilus TaxID=2582849 RepID=UPI00110D6807|nr:tail fiber domain-containing protein [Paenibacillus mesophilus]TMV48952.1 tail fiber domain-containing protein [Paenibacillus mesophilus]
MRDKLDQDIADGTIFTESEERVRPKLSRRKLLASLGAAGATVAAAEMLGMTDVVFGKKKTVSEEVYGHGYDLVTSGSSVPQGVDRLCTEYGVLYLWEPSGDFAASTHIVASITPNSFSGYDVVTDRGTYEFLPSERHAARVTGNVYGWGAVLDGVTDDVLRVQKAIDSCSMNAGNSSQSPNRTYASFAINTGGKIAAVSASVVLKNNVNLECFYIRAVGTWAGEPVLKTNGTYFVGNAKDIVVDGNNLNCKGIVVSHIYGAVWDTVYVYNTKKDCFTTNAPGYELLLNNFRLVSSPNCDEFTKGLVVNSGDGHFTNGITIFNPIGTEVNGGSNHLSFIHGWSGYYANGKDPGTSGGREQRIGFLINASNNHINMCQSDSPSRKDYSQAGETILADGLPNGGIGFFFGDAAFRVKSESCALVVNSTLYQNAANADGRPVNAIIAPFYVGGRDCSVINFRQENKATLAPPIFKNDSIKGTTTVSGCDLYSNNLHSRTLNPVLELNTQSGSSILKAKIDGVEVGGIKTPNTSAMSVYALDQLHLDAGTATGWRLSAGGGTVRLEPRADGGSNLGSSGTRISNFYVVNAPIVGSDARMKKDWGSIPQPLCDFVLNTEIVQYKLIKNESDRYHYGIVITEPFLAELGKVTSINHCGALCHDIFTDDSGKPIDLNVGGANLGDLWQVRYDEWQNILLEAIRRKFIQQTQGV